MEEKDSKLSKMFLRNGTTALMFAIEGKLSKYIDEICRIRKFNPNVVDKWSRSALHLCALESYTRGIEAICSTGPNCNLKDYQRNIFVY